MKKPLFLFLFCYLISLIFLGCATEPKNRVASDFLLTTDKASTMLFADIKTLLDNHKYKIKKEDAAAGILLLEPRNFSYMNGNSKTLAHQIIQMRQEGGSMKVRISYECNYSGDRKEFVPCLDEDVALNDKISRIETGLLDLIQPLLLKHADAVVESTPKPAKTTSGPTPNRVPARVEDTSF